MNTAVYVQGQLEQAFGLLETVTNGLTDEQYNAAPGGTANAPAKSHIHALTSIDFFVTRMIRGADLAWPAFAATHGLPANPMEIWGYVGTVPLAAVSDYAATVKHGVMDYAGTLGDAEFDREVETQFFGKKTVAWILQLGIAHVAGHAGDIAGVKGVQGLKGLPF